MIWLDIALSWKITKVGTTTLFSKIDLCSATSMESSRRDLLNDITAGQSWEITKIRTTPVLFSHPKLVWHTLQQLFRFSWVHKRLVEIVSSGLPFCRVGGWRSCPWGKRRRRRRGSPSGRARWGIAGSRSVRRCTASLFGARSGPALAGSYCGCPPAGSSCCRSIARSPMRPAHKQRTLFIMLTHKLITTSTASTSHN